MTWHKLYIKISKSQIHNVPRPSKALSHCLATSFHSSSSLIFRIREVQKAVGLTVHGENWRSELLFLSGSLICSKTSCTLHSVWNSIPVPFSVIFYIPRHIFLWGKKKKLSKPCSSVCKRTSGMLCMAIHSAVRWHCSVCRKNYWHHLQFHVLNVIFWHNLKISIFMSP
jgi:hypothetical protein